MSGLSTDTISQPKDDPIQVCGWHGNLYWLLMIFVRGEERALTPLPGMVRETHSPLKSLIPIESKAGLSQNKGKGKGEAEMDKGKPEKARSPSLTISKYMSAFHHGEDSAFVYNWIDDNHGDSFSDQDVKESKWLTDQSYMDAND